MSVPILPDNLSKSTTIHTKHIRGDMDDLQIHLTHNNLLSVYTALSDYLTLDIDSFNHRWDIFYYYCKYSSQIYTWKHFWCKTRSIRWLASILSLKGSFLYVGLGYIIAAWTLWVIITSEAIEFACLCNRHIRFVITLHR